VGAFVFLVDVEGYDELCEIRADVALIVNEGPTAGTLLLYLDGTGVFSAASALVAAFPAGQWHHLDYDEGDDEANK
jgi:hypothetical protein